MNGDFNGVVLRYITKTTFNRLKLGFKGHV